MYVAVLMFTDPVSYSIWSFSHIVIIATQNSWGLLSALLHLLAIQLKTERSEEAREVLVRHSSLHKLLACNSVWSKREPRIYWELLVCLGSPDHRNRHTRTKQQPCCCALQPHCNVSPIFKQFVAEIRSCPLPDLEIHNGNLTSLPQTSFS